MTKIQHLYQFTLKWQNKQQKRMETTCYTNQQKWYWYRRKEWCTIIDTEDVIVSAVPKLKGLVLPWNNIKGGKISLLISDLECPKLSFPIFIPNGHCGNLSNDLPPYRILKKNNTCIKIRLYCITLEY